MGQWFFEQRRGGPLRNPQEAELFKDDQTAEGEYAGNDHLVREVIQNSLDARSAAADGPVQVALTLYEAADAPPESRLAYYFARLESPLIGRDVEFRRSGAPALPCRFLVCEDFGTRGLEGDPAFYDNSSAGHGRQDFYWFWRNIGKSGKTGDDLGRWGLGKTVFRAVSRVGSMLGLTIRESDRRALLMGQTVLQSHRHEEIEYHPEGYWHGDLVGDLPMPIVGPDEIDRFRREWRLTRTIEPGMSVVAPFVPEELSAERILQAVIVHFFTRILRGELEVETAGAGLGHRRLDAATIEDEAARMQWTGSQRMKRRQPPPIAFAKECVGRQPTYTTAVLGTKRAPDFDDESLPADELAKLQQSFADGELVSLRVRVALPRRQGDDQVGSLDVFLKRHVDGQRRDSYYVREGMTIAGMNSTAAARGVQALVLVDRGPMAEFLGDSEGPAHEKWSTGEDRPALSWKHGWKGRVNFARRIVDHVVEYLTPPKIGPDRELLADFFSLEKPQGAQRTRQRGDKEPGEGVFPPVAANPKWYHITERAGGFSVLRSQGAPLPPDPTLEVTIAYDLPRGNPLRNWSPLDFEISNKPGGLKPAGEGLKPKLLQGNRVQLVVVDDKFSFSLDGFDRYRDLYVRVDDVSGANGHVEEDGDD